MQFNNERLLLLIIHLVRDPQTILAALNKLEPELFNRPFEVPYQSIWHISREYYREYKECISKLQMQAELVDLASKSPQLAGQIEQANEMVELIYALPDKDIHAPSTIKRILQPLLDDRMVVATMNRPASLENLKEYLDEQRQVYEKSRVVLHTDIDLTDFRNPALNEVDATPIPTGCIPFDIMSNGGIRPGNFTGVLGAYGSGKTQLSLQLGASIARSNMTAIVFHYEQNVRTKLRHRIWSTMIGVPTSKLLELDHEKKMDEVGHLFESLDADYGMRYRVLDMNANGQAANGIDGIRQLVREHIDNGHQAPAALIVDWYGTMARKYMAANNINPEQTYNILKMYNDQFKKLSDEFSCEVVLCHQMNTETASKDCSYMGNEYDAADCKSFAELQDTCILLGRKDRNNILRMHNAKVRGEKADLWVRNDNDLCRFIPLNGDYSIIRDSNGAYWADIGSGSDIL